MYYLTGYTIISTPIVTTTIIVMSPSNLRYITYMYTYIEFPVTLCIPYNFNSFEASKK